MQNASPERSTVGEFLLRMPVASLRLLLLAAVLAIALLVLIASRTPAPAPDLTPAIELRPVSEPSLSIMSIDRLFRPTVSTSVLRSGVTLDPVDSALSSIEPAPAAMSSDQINVSRFIAQKYRLPLVETRRYVRYAFDVADEHALDPLLILAVMSIESSFNPRARSSKGAKGLMQVLARLHAEKFAPYGGVAKAYDPLVNIRVGARILRSYIDRDGSVRAALKSYVGAALLSHDFGYGRKVLRERARLRAAADQGTALARQTPVPFKPAKVPTAGAIASRERMPASNEPIVPPAGDGGLPVNHRTDAAIAVEPASPAIKIRRAKL